MKRMMIAFLFSTMSLVALLVGTSCSNQSPNTPLIAPLKTISADNPTWTFTPSPTFTPSATPTPAFPVSGFNGPYALAIDSKSHLYVGDTGNNLIKQYVNGVLNTNWPSGKIKNINGLSYTSPKAIAIDNLGNLYVVGNGDMVSKYDSNGNFIAQYAAAMSGPEGVAVNSAGTTLYVSDTGNKQIVSFLLPGGELNTGFGSSGKLSVSPYTPYGLALDSSGNLYVAGSDNNIYLYTSTGSPGTPALIPGFKSPYAVALDTQNDLYVSDTGNGQIEEFTTGQFIDSPSNIIGVGVLSKPEGIVLDSSGNVYVVDSTTNELYQFP